MALLAAGMALILAVPSLARAQATLNATEHVAFDRPESWALAYFASATLVTGLEPPHARPAGSLALGIEVNWLPAVSDAQRFVGFDGTKQEDLNKTPVVLRPRLTIGLPGQWSIIVAVVPPIPVFGVSPRLLAVAVERPVVTTSQISIGARGYGQIGSVTGAYTCPPGVLSFEPGTPGNLYGCQAESSDRATLGYAGAEGSVAYRSDALKGLSPHAAIAVTYMDLGFQVNAQTFGFLDQTHLLTHGTTWSTSAGVSSRLSSKFDVSVDVFYTPLSVQRPNQAASNEGLFNVRALAVYRLRR
jgi:hypothetical protein